MPTVPGTPLPPKGPSLRTELQGLKDMANKSTMPKKYSQELGRIIDDEVINRFQKGGATSGETLQEIKSSLTNLSKQKMRSENYDVRKQGLALQEANAALRRMIDRENPTYAADLKAADTAYAKFKIAQAAAAAPGAKGGVFTPAQYAQAVRKMDRTKDKDATSRGKANQQAFAAAAKNVIGDTMPDSGTPYQALAAALLAPRKGMGLLGIPGGLAGSALLGPLYSPTGVKLMNRMIQSPPNFGAGAGMALPIGAAEAGQQ
jgi:hypothetical protein